MLGRDVETVKKIKAQIKLTEMKNTMSEMKNTLDGINSRLDVIEAAISEFKDITVETNPNETQRENKKRGDLVGRRAGAKRQEKSTQRTRHQ